MGHTFSGVMLSAAKCALLDPGGLAEHLSVNKGTPPSEANACEIVFDTLRPVSC
jgi:hypothetical protein